MNGKFEEFLALIGSTLRPVSSVTHDGNNANP